MRYSKLMYAAVVGMVSVQMAGAAPTAEEAAELGKSLTPIGAIKAGNKDGTIPEWTGGVCTPPAGYKPAKGLELGGAPYINPFAADKPAFKITAAAVAKYADKLDDGTKEMFKRHPKTFFIDVYPTRRSACWPAWAYENTIKRVMNPKIVGGNVPSVTGAHAQIPFPIPKSGAEVMWNTQLKYEPTDLQFEIAAVLVDSSGNRIPATRQWIYNQNNYWDNTKTSVPEDKAVWTLISKSTQPASQVGTMQMRHVFLRPDQKGAPAWSYIPGQRRVRLAPEFAYDSVSTTSGGVMLFDEINGFDGKMDRFDFKLVGRKEMYVPYNNYDFWQATPEVSQPNHVDPASLRFELHRVWVVEANLKQGERHVQKKKTFYVDEDSWAILAYVGIDHADKVHHLMYLPSIQEYDKPMLRNQQFLIYDFAKSIYLNQNKSIGNWGGGGGPMFGTNKAKPYPPNYFTPDSLAGMGVR